jgi:hypothetical protein
MSLLRGDNTQTRLILRHPSSGDILSIHSPLGTLQFSPPAEKHRVLMMFNIGTTLSLNMGVRLPTRSQYKLTEIHYAFAG